MRTPRRHVAEDREHPPAPEPADDHRGARAVLDAEEVKSRAEAPAQVTDAAAAATFSRRFFASALEHELLLRPIGRTVYLMPPYVMDDDEIDGLATRTRTVFEQVMKA